MMIGNYLGLDLKQGQKTEDMQAAIEAELLKVHQALAWFLPAPSRGGDIAACRDRIDSFYEYARKKKFKRVRPAKGRA